MAREDPTIYMRIPSELKKQLDDAAAKNGRSLTAEVVGRLQHSFDQRPEATALDLAPTVVRMERDIASLEVEKATESLKVRVIASTLRPLLDSLPKEQVLRGFLHKGTVEDWVRLCDAYLRFDGTFQDDLDDAFARLKKAELAVRDLAPESGDPIWEQMAILRAAREQDKGAGQPPEQGAGEGKAVVPIPTPVPTEPPRATKPANPRIRRSKP